MLISRNQYCADFYKPTLRYGIDLNKPTPKLYTNIILHAEERRDLVLHGDKER